MPLPDRLIVGREKVINRILKTDPAQTLNSPGASVQSNPGENSLAGEIKDSLNTLKSLALSENGKVDYQKIAQDPHYQHYRDLAARLQDFDFMSLKTVPEKLAFWINLYNAMVIDAVIRENIRKSVTESRLGIMAFFQRAAYQVYGQRFSLTDIEQGLLRANRGFPYFPGPHFASSDPRLEAVVEPFDPRIHFALNCASISCPPIRVYTPERIHDQLDLAAGNFINNETSFSPERNQISISKIFQWYQVDFGGKSGILQYIGSYIQDQKLKSLLTNSDHSVKIHFHAYDWGLNKIRD